MKPRIPIVFLEKQLEVFIHCNARRRYVRKGGRLGFTQGGIHYLHVEILKGGGRNFLWGDTIQGNLRLYFNKFWRPLLNQLPPDQYKWNFNSQLLFLEVTGPDGTATCTFRSKQNPYNWEGFSYDIIYLNEAGIILSGDRGKYIWEQAVRKMLIDNPESILIVGGVPKGPGLYDDLLVKAKEEAEKGNEDYAYFHFSTYDNESLSRAEIDQAVEDLGPVAEQEIFGNTIDAGADAYNLFSQDSVMDAVERWKLRRKEGVTPKDVTAVGIDPSRGGTDETAIATRSGGYFHELTILSGLQALDGPAVSSAFKALKAKRSIGDGVPVNVDSVGIGAGVYDLIKMAHPATNSIAAGAKVKATTKNKVYRLTRVKDEMYWRFKEALDEGLIDLPDDPLLIRQLLAIKMDPKVIDGVVKIEKKDETKKRIGQSPDRAEACILCWYQKHNPLKGAFKNNQPIL